MLTTEEQREYLCNRIQTIAIKKTLRTKTFWGYRIHKDHDAVWARANRLRDEVMLYTDIPARNYINILEEFARWTP